MHLAAQLRPTLLELGSLQRSCRLLAGLCGGKGTKREKMDGLGGEGGVAKFCVCSTGAGACISVVVLHCVLDI